MATASLIGPGVDPSPNAGVAEVEPQEDGDADRGPDQPDRVRRTSEERTEELADRSRGQPVAAGQGVVRQSSEASAGRDRREGTEHHDEEDQQHPRDSAVPAARIRAS